MSSIARSRLSKQSRVFCGHCNQYLSRTTFWKHRRLYYDVHSERWTNENLGNYVVEEAKRRKRDFYESSDRRSDSSGGEDIETVASSEGVYRYFWNGR